MKIVKSAKHYTEAALDEVGLLECVGKSDPAELGRAHVVELVAHFMMDGPHGKRMQQHLS